MALFLPSDTHDITSLLMRLTIQPRQQGLDAGNKITAFNWNSI